MKINEDLENQKIANRARLDVLELAKRSNKEVHFGGVFSMMELVAVLYQSVISVDEGIKLVLSKGHGATAVYSVMHQLGLLDDILFYSYREDGSPLTELMEYNTTLFFEASGGSLGLGLSLGVGMALDMERKKNEGRIYVLTGDGELNEGSVWEATMAASHYRLNNLCLVVDRNQLQIDGSTEDVMRISPLEEKFSAFGWETVSIDGHNCREIRETLRRSPGEKPLAIIANTVKGKGVSFMEGNQLWHERAMTKEELVKAREELMCRAVAGE